MLRRSAWSQGAKWCQMSTCRRFRSLRRRYRRCRCSRAFRGLALLAVKRPDEALSGWDRILATDPAHVGAIHNRAPASHSGCNPATARGRAGETIRLHEHRELVERRCRDRRVRGAPILQVRRDLHRIDHIVGGIVFREQENQIILICGDRRQGRLSLVS